MISLPVRIFGFLVADVSSTTDDVTLWWVPNTEVTWRGADTEGDAMNFSDAIAISHRRGTRRCFSWTFGACDRGSPMSRRVATDGS